MKTLHTIEKIKAAVDAGQTVHCDNDSYTVIKDSYGQYLITRGDYAIGLRGTYYANKLNGGAFYVI